MKRLIKNFINNFRYSMIEFPAKFFTDKPLETKEHYKNLYNQEVINKYVKIDKFENKLGYKIDKDWIDNLALHTQIVIKKNKLNFQHGRILYALLRYHINKNNLKNITIFETGTSRGFSSVCMSKAINDSSIAGKVITFDILPHNKKMYWNIIFDHDGMRSRSELLSKWPDELKNIIFIEGWTNKQINKTGIQRINFAFLDAQHEYENVMQEYRYVLDRQEKDDMIIFDDVLKTQYSGVNQAVTEIEKNGLYKIDYIESSELRGYAIATKI